MLPVIHTLHLLQALVAPLAASNSSTFLNELRRQLSHSVSLSTCAFRCCVLRHMLLFCSTKLHSTILGRACPLQSQLLLAGMNQVCCLLFSLLLSLPEVRSMCLDCQARPLHLWGCRPGCQSDHQPALCKD